MHLAIPSQVVQRWHRYTLGKTKTKAPDVLRLNYQAAEVARRVAHIPVPANSGKYIGEYLSKLLAAQFLMW